MLYYLPGAHLPGAEALHKTCNHYIVTSRLVVMVVGRLVADWGREPNARGLYRGFAAQAKKTLRLR